MLSQVVYLLFRMKTLKLIIAKIDIGLKSEAHERLSQKYQHRLMQRSLADDKTSGQKFLSDYCNPHCLNNRVMVTQFNCVCANCNTVYNTDYLLLFSSKYFSEEIM